MNIVTMAINGNISSYNNAQTKKITQNPKQHNKKTTLCSFTGSTIGILSVLGLIFKQAKKSNPNLLFKNLKYEERDILAIGFGSVTGGVLGGSFVDKDNKIPKIREALMQFFGSLACPLAILHCSNNLLDKSKFKLPQLDNKYKYSKQMNTILEAAPKIAVTAGSLYLGMHIGNNIMNKVNNMIFDKKENREVHSSDYLVHADDVCIAASLLLKDNKNITSIMSKALPASFILAGTKSGMQHS